MLHEICNPIFSDFVKTRTKTKLTKDEWRCLSTNPHPLAIAHLTSNQMHIDWEMLSANPGAVHLLEKNPDKINWYQLSSNYNAIHIIEKNMPKINWKQLSTNKNAVHILLQHMDKIDWDYLSSNTNPIAMDLLTKNLHRINCWLMVSQNPSAINILLENSDQIWWDGFAINPHDTAVNMVLDENQNKTLWWDSPATDPRDVPEGMKLEEYEAPLRGNIHLHIGHHTFNRSKNINSKILQYLITKHPDKIEYTPLSANPNPLAIKHLAENPAKINWEIFLTNPSMFPSYV